MSKNRKVLTGILCVCLVAALAIGGTLAYLTDSDEETNTFTVGNIDIELEEKFWDDDGVADNPETPENEYVPGDGENLYPGTIKVKDPVITAPEHDDYQNDSYMRAVITIIDNNEGENKGKVITDEDRLDLILKTIRYDETYNYDADLDDALDTVTTNIVEGDSLPEEDLKTYYPTVNPAFVYDEARSKLSPGNYYYNYQGVFEEGTSVALFTNIAIPYDWDNAEDSDEMSLLGSYKVVVTAQAIQTSNVSEAGAFKALEGALAAKN